MNIVGVSFSYSENSMAYRGLLLMDHFLQFSDIIKIDIPLCDSNKPDGVVPEDVDAFIEKLRVADVLVFSIPEYTSHYSAAFKNAMDWLVVATNYNSTLGTKYPTSDKPVYVMTFTPANEGAGHRHFDMTSELLEKLGAEVKQCVVKNTCWMHLVPGNFSFVEQECKEILNTRVHKQETVKQDMSNEVPGWIEKYNKWNEQWKK